MAQKRHEKSEFGAYLVDAIREAGMYQTDFITAVGIARPYFYNILTGSPPPRDTLEKMYGVLEKKLPPDDTRHHMFMNLAAKCRGEIPSDIEEMIRLHPEQWDDIRVALTQMLTAK